MATGAGAPEARTDGRVSGLSPLLSVDLSSKESLQGMGFFRKNPDILNDETFGENLRFGQVRDGVPGVLVELAGFPGFAFSLPAVDRIPVESMAVKFDALWEGAVTPVVLFATQGGRQMALEVKGNALEFRWTVPMTRIERRNQEAMEAVSGSAPSKKARKAAQEAAGDGSAGGESGDGEIAQNLSGSVSLEKAGVRADRWHEFVITLEPGMGRVIVDGKVVIETPGLSLAAGWEPRRKRKGQIPAIQFVNPGRGGKGTLRLSGIVVSDAVPAISSEKNQTNPNPEVSQ